MFPPGTVLLHDKYEFTDVFGTVEDRQDKYFIVIGKINGYLTAITTSQTRHYKGATDGCNQNLKVFVISPGEGGLDRTTFVKMTQLVPMQIEDLEVKVEARIVTERGRISEKCFNRLKSCLSQFKRITPMEQFRVITSTNYNSKW